MSLLDRLDDDDQSEAWKPAQPGDTLHGHIVGFGRRITEYSPDGYLIVTIKDAAGKTWAVHAFHFVLEEELKKYRLKLGTEIAIRFMGKPQGKNYVSYKVASDAEVNMGPADPQAGQYSPETDFPAQAPVSSAPVQTGADDDLPF